MNNKADELAKKGAEGVHWVVGARWAAGPAPLQSLRGFVRRYISETERILRASNAFGTLNLIIGIGRRAYNAHRFWKGLTYRAALRRLDYNTHPRRKKEAEVKLWAAQALLFKNRRGKLSAKRSQSYVG